MPPSHLPPIKRIAIVGAGPGGIVTAKYLLAEQCYAAVDIFEQQSTLGGVWTYDPVTKKGVTDIPQTDPHQPLETPKWLSDGRSPKKPKFLTPMYDGLETNIPDVLMKHSDDDSLLGHQLFPRRETVLQYLRDYGRDFESRVRFNTQVYDADFEATRSPHQWRVSSRDLLTRKESVGFYDAVCVASGHYAVPHLPRIAGIEQWNAAYPDAISHSKFYRDPTPFKDKKTLVVGYAASGVDITLHLSTSARLPILVSRRSVSYLSHPVSYIEDVPEIAEFVSSSQSSRAVRFADGRIETDIDAVMFCTGYFFSYPFLASLRPPLVTDGMRVEQLYQHIFWINNPTLAFVGLPSKVIPFRTFEGQASVIAKVWANRIQLPDEVEMHKWNDELVSKANGGNIHIMDHPKDFLYHNELVSWSLQTSNPGQGLISPKWAHSDFFLRERFPAIKRAFNERGEKRHGVKDVKDLGSEFDSERK